MRLQPPASLLCIVRCLLFLLYLPLYSILVHLLVATLVLCCSALPALLLLLILPSFQCQCQSTNTEDKEQQPFCKLHGHAHKLNKMQAKAVCCTYLQLRLSAAELGAPPSTTASGSHRTSFSCRHRLNWQRYKQSFSTGTMKIIEKWLRDGPVRFALLRLSFSFDFDTLPIGSYQRTENLRRPSARLRVQT